MNNCTQKDFFEELFGKDGIESKTLLGRFIGLFNKKINDGEGER